MLSTKDSFAKEVRRSLDGSILRYSQRVRLLRRAAILGIGRFEANLLIAMEEHKARGKRLPVEDKSIPVGVLAFLVTQVVILIAVVWLFGALR